MSKLGLLCVTAGLCTVGTPLAADGERIPVFATGPNTGWVLDHAFGVDDLLQRQPVALARRHVVEQA